MVELAESGAKRATCMTYGQDLRSLYFFSRRIAAASQIPVLANEVELCADLANRIGLNIILVDTPQGDATRFISEVTVKLMALIPNARLIFEATDPDTSQWTGTTQQGLVHFFDRGAAPMQIKAVIDVATFAEGCVGSIAKVELVDFLQLLIMNRRSSAVNVRGSGRTGLIIVRSGEIVDARCGELVGNPALFKILSSPRGQFSETEPPPVVETTVEGRSDMLILEALRLRDERSHKGRASSSSGDMVKLSPSSDELDFGLDGVMTDDEHKQI